MIPVAPTWAFFGAAIDAQSTEPHVPAGAHFRFQPSKRIGLPSTPLFVRRLVVTNPDGHPNIRTAITWVDTHGNTLSTPFTVTPDNPVRGHLPGNDCSWISVAEPNNGSGLTVEAQVQTSRGPATIATRSGQRYVLSGQVINQILITGSGVVSGVRWLDLKPLLAGAQAFRTLSMPIASAARYAPIQPLSTARSQATQRVLAGGPKRISLIQNPTFNSPGLATPIVPSDETARLSQFTGSIDANVNTLMNSVSTPQGDMAAQHPIANLLTPSATKTASVKYLGRVLQSLADPGIARYLGFADLDTDTTRKGVTGASAIPAGSIVVYQAIAGWNVSASMMTPAAYDSLAQITGGEKPISDFVMQVPEAAAHPFGHVTRVWMMSGLAVATVGYPPHEPAAPIAEAVVDRGWRTDDAHEYPNFARVVGLKTMGLFPAASIALARRDGGVWVSQNAVKHGYRLPLVPSVVKSKFLVGLIGRGYFVDHQAPPQQTQYRLCQADWFGRFSAWTEMTAPAKSHPIPAIPVVEMTYRAAEAPDGDPDSTQKLPGKLTLTVPVPDTHGLPPGGYPLQTLQLTFTDGVEPPFTLAFDVNPFSQSNPKTTAAFHPQVQPAPGVPDDQVYLIDRLSIEREGPGLQRSEVRYMTVTGVWQDKMGAWSKPSGAIKVKMVDPRSPLAPDLPTELIYTARPDVTGKARFQFSWKVAAASVRHRVYFTTDAIALRFFQREVEREQAKPNPNQNYITVLTQAYDEVSKAEQGAVRAGVLRANSSLLPYDAFESLSREPIMPVDAQGALAASFEHVVSGSFEGLALYKILAESDHGVTYDFGAAPMLTVAVPNLGAPTRPLLAASELPRVNGEPTGVRLHVTVPKNRAAIKAYRLRRTITPGTDPRKWREVASGPIPANRVVTDRTIEFSLDDPYPLHWWSAYQWSVEVQADAPPGAPNNSPVPIGEWSAPSAPARISVIPPPPPPPTQVTATRANKKVDVAISLDPATPAMKSNPRGVYRIEVVRRSSAGREVLSSAPISPDPVDPNILHAIDDSPLVAVSDGTAVDTYYAVRIIDPAGRASAFVTDPQPA
jgi:hypothetical protein